MFSASSPGISSDPVVTNNYHATMDVCGGVYVYVRVCTCGGMGVGGMIIIFNM